MILTSTGATTPFTPIWQLDAGGNPKPDAWTFHLRAGSVIERGQLEAELAGVHRAGQVYGYELRLAVRSGILSLLADDPDLDRLLGLVEAEADAEADELTADDKQLLIAVRNILGESWPEYRDLVAQLERRRAIAPIVALRRYCTGIDAPGVDFVAGPDGFMSDGTLAQIEPFLLSVAGNQAYGLQLPRGQEGNSKPLSPSDDSPKPSSSDDASMADGKSAIGDGTRIPD